MLEKSTADGIAGIADITASRWFSDSFRDAHHYKKNRIREMILRTSLDGYHGCIQALLSVDFANRLPEITMPALFVSGALDVIGGPTGVMQKMTQTVQNGQHLELPDAGHIRNIANPAAYDNALLSFFASL